MATRIKSIAYSFLMNFSDVPDDSEYSFPSITVTIPEAALGVTFRSAMLEIGFHDKVTATGGTIDDYHVSMQIDASGYTTIDDEDDFAPGGAYNMGGVLGPFDFTTLFVANWNTNLTHTVYAKFRIDQSTGTTLGMRALTAVLWLTYEYDDASQYHAKTAIIPLESLTNSLSTTPDSEIGTNQIPRMTGTGGFLPESGITILDYFFLIEGNITPTAVGNFNLTWKIDSGAASVMTAVCALANSSYFLRYVSRHTGSEPALDSIHAFRMWSSVANRMHTVTITLYVTYQFDATGSTTTLNVQILPLGAPQVTAFNCSDLVALLDTWVEEPETITLKQSAVRLNYFSSRCGFQFWIGLQQSTPRSYTINSSTYFPGGQYALQQRFDSGAQVGLGLDLSRGLNRVVFGLHHQTSGGVPIGIFGGQLILNYHSTRATQGVGSHAHSVRISIAGMDLFLNTTGGVNEYSNKNAYLPEAAYRLIGLAMIAENWSVTYLLELMWDALLLGVEADEPHLVPSCPSRMQFYATRVRYTQHTMPMDHARRWPDDPKVDGFDVTVPRTLHVDRTYQSRLGLFLLYCYHSITFEVSGTIAGYSGDGSGITVNLFRSDTDELIGSATTTAGGTYTFIWYDDTIPVYAVARQDSQRCGRSDDGMAS